LKSGDPSGAARRARWKSTWARYSSYVRCWWGSSNFCARSQAQWALDPPCV
jgi:hypothetical protein